MLSFAFILSFVFCGAIASTGILIGHQLISNYNARFLKIYFYYVIAFFAFATIAIWGQIMMQTLLSSMDAPSELRWGIMNTIPIVGLPFLLIAWVMLIKMGVALVEVPGKGGTVWPFMVLFALVAIGITTIFWFEPAKNGLWGVDFARIEIALITGIELAVHLVLAAMVLLYIKKAPAFKRKFIKSLAWLLLAGLLLRMSALSFYSVDPWLLAPLILIYFVSILPPLWYINYHADKQFALLHAAYPNENKKTLLYQKYQITPREQDIIEELCLGKTNQQIADTLFITLQTVKDHTHRIYTKVGINSRMKLVQLIND